MVAAHSETMMAAAPVLLEGADASAPGTGVGVEVACGCTAAADGARPFPSGTPPLASAVLLLPTEPEPELAEQPPPASPTSCCMHTQSVPSAHSGSVLLPAVCCTPRHSSR